MTVLGLSELTSLIKKEFGEESYQIEDILNEVYERLAEREQKLFVLQELYRLSETIDKDIKLKGSPHTFWVEVLYRICVKYIDLKESDQAKEIIIMLGKLSVAKQLKTLLKDRGLS
jgi:hypothetical protein